MYSLDLHSLRALRGGRWSGIGANVFFLGLTSMLTDISSEMVTSILPVYMAFALGLTPVQLGFADGIYQGGSALARLGSGWVSDRWRRDREVAAAGYALSCACKLGLLAAGSSWPALSSVIALDRLGKGVRTSPRDALISMASAPGRLGLAFGIHRAFDTLGALLGPLLAFAILWQLSDAYDVVFITSFFIALVAVAVLLLFVRNAPRADPAAARAATSAIAMAAPLRERRFRSALIAGTALGLVTLADSFFYLALQRQAAIDPASFPLLSAATAVTYLALAIPAGRLGDRIGRGKVFLLGHVLLLGACASLYTADAGPGAWVLPLALLGAYYACTDGVLMAVASALVPPSMRATGLAIMATATGTARLLASIAFGFAWSHWGMDVAVLAFTAGLAMALLLTARAWTRLESAS